MQRAARCRDGPTLKPFTYWLLPWASAAATTAAVGLLPENCCPLCSMVTCAHQHTANLHIQPMWGQQCGMQACTWCTC